MMVDFHTHILPCIDDGSKTVEQSIEMLRLEASQGVTDVVLTSHFYAAKNNIHDYILSREKAFYQLKSHLEPGLPKLHLGAEVQYFEGICVADEVVDLCILGTDLLLLEMPFSGWSDRVVQDVLMLNSRKDIHIMLAHIDRYLSFQDPDLWPYLADHGVLMQVNTSFFKGFWNRRKAMKMVQNSLIHALGTDCHSLHSRAPDWSVVPESILNQINRMSYLPVAQPFSL